MSRKALVVGINDYPGTQNDLPSCLNDARQFRSVLQSTYGFTVRTLADGDATIARVEDELDWLFRGATANDRLVFYYSGHGHTKLVNGIMQEFLVLYDGLFQDDALSRRTQNLPDGILTVIFDSCFSGGMQKVVPSPDDGAPVELARVKRWIPAPDEDGEVTKSGSASAYKRFGLSAVTTAIGAEKLFSPPEVFNAPKTKAAPGEESEPVIKGLLIAACREDETAAASTSRTEGLSAFTWAFLKTLRHGGPNATAEQAFRAAAILLANAKFRQTPVILEPAKPGNLRWRTFLKMSKPIASAKAVNGVEPADELPRDKFWNIVLPILTSVAPAVLREITQERHKGPDGVETEMDTETKEKFLGAIASVLPDVLATVPRIVNAVRRRRRKDFVFDLEVGAENVDDKAFGAVAPLVPEIIRSIAPAVLEAITSITHKSAAGTNGTSASNDAAISAVTSMIPTIVSASLPAVLEEDDEDTTAEDEAGSVSELEMQKGILSRLGRLAGRVVRRVSPIIINALAQRKSSTGEDPEAQQKFLGLLASAVPVIIGAVSPLLRRSRGRKKSADAAPYDVGSVVVDERSQESAVTTASTLNSIVPAVVEAVAESADAEEEASQPLKPETASTPAWSSALVA